MPTGCKTVSIENRWKPGGMEPWCVTHNRWFADCQTPSNAAPRVWPPGVVDFKQFKDERGKQK